MSRISAIQKRIEYLQEQLRNEADEDRKISMHEDLELAKDDLRFEYAEQEAEEDYQRMKSAGWA